MTSSGSYFLENVQQRKSVFRLRRRVRIACEPIPWSAQGDQQIEEKKQPISELLFLARMLNILEKELQKVSKRVTLFPGWRLLGHLWSPKLIFDSKSEPTAPPKCSQGPKNASKMIPKGQKMILKVTLKVHSLGTLTLNRRFEQRPGGLRAAH